MTDAFSSSTLYQVIEARQRLQDYAMANELVLNYFVLFKNSGLVLNHELIARLPEVSQMLSYPDYDRFLEELVDRYHVQEVRRCSTVKL
ncbi:hypothetical protein N6H14_26020 [Paenibacillus sp. CC-CFT747]|nr:hypothetical protein N6H14_26020 [Paenibacillus sp. CC-CFT747]